MSLRHAEKILAGDSEAEIKAGIKDALRRAGWKLFDSADNRRVRKQLAGLPDLVCFRHGVTLLIEAKSATGRLEPSQLMFREIIKGHTGASLLYCVARGIDDLPPEVFVLPGV